MSALFLICRHVVNGEILGVSLLLEDVLAAGRPVLSFTDTGESDELSGRSNADRKSRASR